MVTNLERLFSLSIGTVESVAPDAIDIVLDHAAPRATALNSGVPTGFPRINGYILIPNEGGSLVGLIIKLWSERAAGISKRDTKELIDLPFPLRKLTVIPVGTLGGVAGDVAGGYRTTFKRGVTVFPSVGDNVLIPTSEQLRAIVESETHSRRVAIGTSPLLANSIVALDPDRLFGGHLAVLGNTGSGKSCSVAGLIRWSLEAAQSNRVDTLRSPGPNARFIVLDPNGEYKTSFRDVPGGVRVFQLPPPDSTAEALTVPGWIWNINEWCAFSSAAPALQRPLLQQTIRALRTGGPFDGSVGQSLRRRILFFISIIEERLSSGGSKYGVWGPAQSFADFLKVVSVDGAQYIESVDGDTKRALFALISRAKSLRDEHRYTRPDGEAYNPFSESELKELHAQARAVLETLPPGDNLDPVRDDAPVPFDVNALPDYLEQLAAHANSQVASMTAGLVVRIRNMLADSRLSGVIAPENAPTFAEWLTTHIGADGAANGPVAVLDLSLIPTEIIHTVVAVIARVVFEALQRYLRATDSELPTVLVLEEAHTFISRATESDNANLTAADACRATFERIAREGRKFGLGLIISSQRPSEISPTVLSQCNTFILHRLVNDRDQDLVGRLVPDSLGGMLRELPTLPARHVIIVGQATPLPLLVEINELRLEHQPRSYNPRFWDVWTGLKHRPINWDAIVEDWGG